MQQFDIYSERRPRASWSKFFDKIIYLPGAVVIVYGLWLATSV